MTTSILDPPKRWRRGNQECWESNFMPAVKPGALPVEMLLPIAGTMGLSCPALASLTVPMPGGKALVGHHPNGAALPTPAWQELGSRCQHSPGKLCCLGTGMGPEAMSCKETCFPLGRRALAMSLMSQMERAAQESPEPTAPLQPKWKNTQPHTCLLRP